MADAASNLPRLVVMQSFRELRATSNPFLAQLAESIATEVEVVTFSWRRALFGRFDVFHIHWPELLFVRDGRVRTLLGAVLVALLMLRIRLGRRAVVRTLHNVTPHERRGRVVDAVLRLIDRRTAVFVVMNAQTPVPGGARAVLIPHGHYIDWFGVAPAAAPADGPVLFFGLIREYKGVPALVGAFRGLDDTGRRLRVVGRPDPAALAEQITAAAGGDERVETQFGYADDDTLLREFAAARVVALPYREMNNSGALLLALSLRRPVLVPENEGNAALAAEVGEEWVLRFDGDIDSRVLASALAGQPPTGSPDLSARDWSSVGARHVEVYREALTEVRHDRPYSE